MLIRTTRVCFLAVLLSIAGAVSAASAAGLNETCGGSRNIKCGDDLWCEFHGGCGPELTGVCRKMVTICPAISFPVCGCDGKDYDGVCEIQKTSPKIAHTGYCATKKKKKK